LIDAAVVADVELFRRKTVVVVVEVADGFIDRAGIFRFLQAVANEVVDEGFGLIEVVVEVIEDFLDQAASGVVVPGDLVDVRFEDAVAVGIEPEGFGGGRALAVETDAVVELRELLVVGEIIRRAIRIPS
jgi:hypothetical protein